MKQDWAIKQLGDVCQVQRGLTYSGKDTVDYSNTVVLRATNINLKSSSLVFDELKYLRDDFEIKEIYKLSKGSLLICFSSGSKTHLGKVALIDEDYNYAFGGFIGQVTPTKDISSKYLFYSLISEKYKKYISELTDGVNINNLKIKDLQAFLIPVPPLEEQKRIVAKLDKCFEAIDTARANVERNLNNAKELFQSQLNQIFSQKGDGWVEKKLGEVCEFENGDRGKNYPSRSKFVSEGIPFVNAGHLDNGKVIIENLNYITQENYNLLSRGKFSIGDILFCLRGSLGKYAMIDSLESGAIASSLVIVRVTKELINNFLFYYFDSPICIKMIEEYAGGTAQPNLGAKDLAKFNISYPPLDEQKRTVAKLDALYSQTQSLESNYQQELDALDELKKSILQKAFNGEL